MVSPALRDGILYEDSSPEEDEGGFFLFDAIARGIDQTQAMGYSFVNTLASAVGIDFLAKWGEEGMRRNVEEMAKNPPRLERWDDVDGLADIGTYVLERVFEEVPSLAGTILAAMAGGAVGGPTGAAAGATAARAGTVGLSAAAKKKGLAMFGKAVARKAGPGATAALREQAGKRIGQYAGASAFGIMENTGESRMNQLLEMTEETDAPITALLAGVSKGLLDVYGIDRMSKAVRILGQPGEKIIHAARTKAGAVLGATAGEGITEAAQTVIDQMMMSHLTGEDRFDADEIKESAIAGATVAGALSGTAFGTKKLTEYLEERSKRQDQRNEMLRAELRDRFETEEETPPETEATQPTPPPPPEPIAGMPTPPESPLDTPPDMPPEPPPITEEPAPSMTREERIAMIRRKQAERAGTQPSTEPTAPQTNEERVAMIREKRAERQEAAREQTREERVQMIHERQQARQEAKQKQEQRRAERIAMIQQHKAEREAREATPEVTPEVTQAAPEVTPEVSSGLENITAPLVAANYNPDIGKQEATYEADRDAVVGEIERALAELEPTYPELANVIRKRAYNEIASAEAMANRLGEHDNDSLLSAARQRIAHAATNIPAAINEQKALAPDQLKAAKELDGGSIAFLRQAIRLQGDSDPKNMPLTKTEARETLAHGDGVPATLALDSLIRAMSDQHPLRPLAKRLLAQDVEQKIIPRADLADVRPSERFRSTVSRGTAHTDLETPDTPITVPGVSIHRSVLEMPTSDTQTQEDKDLANERFVEVLLHELTHVVTNTAAKSKKPEHAPFQNQMKDLLKEAKASRTPESEFDPYFLTRTEEMLAGAHTNYAFKKHLQSIPVSQAYMKKYGISGKPISVWKALINSIANFFGWENSNPNVTILDEVLRLSDDNFIAPPSGVTPTPPQSVTEEVPLPTEVPSDEATQVDPVSMENVMADIQAEREAKDVAEQEMQQAKEENQGVVVPESTAQIEAQFQALVDPKNGVDAIFIPENGPQIPDAFMQEAERKADNYFQKRKEIMETWRNLPSGVPAEEQQSVKLYRDAEQNYTLESLQIHTTDSLGGTGIVYTNNPAKMQKLKEFVDTNGTNPVNTQQLGEIVYDRPEGKYDQSGVVVTTTNAEGTSYREVVTSPETINRDVATAEEKAAPGDVVEVRPANEVIRGRVESLNESDAAQGIYDDNTVESPPTTGDIISSIKESTEEQMSEEAEAIRAELRDRFGEDYEMQSAEFEKEAFRSAVDDMPIFVRINPLINRPFDGQLPENLSDEELRRGVGHPTRAAAETRKAQLDRDLPDPNREREVIPYRYKEGPHAGEVRFLIREILIPDSIAVLPYAPASSVMEYTKFNYGTKTNLRESRFFDALIPTPVEDSTQELYSTQINMLAFLAKAKSYGSFLHGELKQAEKDYREAIYKEFFKYNIPISDFRNEMEAIRQGVINFIAASDKLEAGDKNKLSSIDRDKLFELYDAAFTEWDDSLKLQKNLNKKHFMTMAGEHGGLIMSVMARRYLPPEVVAQHENKIARLKNSFIFAQPAEARGTIAATPVDEERVIHEGDPATSVFTWKPNQKRPNEPMLHALSFPQIVQMGMTLIMQEQTTSPISAQNQTREQGVLSGLATLQTLGYRFETEDGPIPGGPYRPTKKGAPAALRAIRPDLITKIGDVTDPESAKYDIPLYKISANPSLQPTTEVFRQYLDDVNQYAIALREWQRDGGKEPVPPMLPWDSASILQASEGTSPKANTAWSRYSRLTRKKNALTTRLARINDHLKGKVKEYPLSFERDPETGGLIARGPLPKHQSLEFQAMEESELKAERNKLKKDIRQVEQELAPVQKLIETVYKNDPRHKIARNDGVSFSVGDRSAALSWVMDEIASALNWETSSIEDLKRQGKFEKSPYSNKLFFIVGKKTYNKEKNRYDDPPDGPYAGLAEEADAADAALRKYLGELTGFTEEMQKLNKAYLEAGAAYNQKVDQRDSEIAAAQDEFDAADAALSQLASRPEGEDLKPYRQKVEEAVEARDAAAKKLQDTKKKWVSLEPEINGLEQKYARLEREVIKEATDDKVRQLNRKKASVEKRAIAFNNRFGKDVLNATPEGYARVDDLINELEKIRTRLKKAKDKREHQYKDTITLLENIQRANKRLRHLERERAKLFSGSVVEREDQAPRDFDEKNASVDNPLDAELDRLEEERKEQTGVAKDLFGQPISYAKLVTPQDREAKRDARAPKILRHGDYSDELVHTLSGVMIQMGDSTPIRIMTRAKFVKFREDLAVAVETKGPRLREEWRKTQQRQKADKEYRDRFGLPKETPTDLHRDVPADEQVVFAWDDASAGPITLGDAEAFLRDTEALDSTLTKLHEPVTAMRMNATKGSQPTVILLLPEVTTETGALNFAQHVLAIGQAMAVSVEHNVLSMPKAKRDRVMKSFERDKKSQKVPIWNDPAIGFRSWLIHRLSYEVSRGYETGEDVDAEGKYNPAHAAQRLRVIPYTDLVGGQLREVMNAWNWAYGSLDKIGPNYRIPEKASAFVPANVSDKTKHISTKAAIEAMRPDGATLPNPTESTNTPIQIIPPGKTTKEMNRLSKRELEAMTEEDRGPIKFEYPPIKEARRRDDFTPKDSVTHFKLLQARARRATQKRLLFARFRKPENFSLTREKKLGDMPDAYVVVVRTPADLKQIAWIPDPNFDPADDTAAILVEKVVNNKGEIVDSPPIVVLVSDNIPNVEQAARYVRHELLGHYGVAHFMTDAERAHFKRLVQASNTRFGVNDIFSEVQESYPDLDEAGQVDEVIGRIAEYMTKPNEGGSFLHESWLKLKDILLRFARKIGFVDKDARSERELRAFYEVVAHRMQRGGITDPVTGDIIYGMSNIPVVPDETPSQTMLRILREAKKRGVTITDYNLGMFADAKHLYHNTGGSGVRMSSMPEANISKAHDKMRKRFNQGPAVRPFKFFMSRAAILRSLHPRLAEMTTHRAQTRMRQEKSYQTGVNDSKANWRGALFQLFQDTGMDDNVALRAKVMYEMATEVPYEQKSPEAQKLTDLLQEFGKYLKENIREINLIDNYFPRKHIIEEYINRQEEVLEIFLRHRVKDPVDVIDHITRFDKNDDFFKLDSDIVNNPGYLKDRRIDNPALIKELVDKGFIESDPRMTLVAYMEKTIKRAELERVFAGLFPTNIASMTDDEVRKFRAMPEEEILAEQKRVWDQWTEAQKLRKKSSLTSEESALIARADLAGKTPFWGIAQWKADAELEFMLREEPDVEKRAELRKLVHGIVLNAPLDRDTKLYKVLAEIKAYESLRVLLGSGIASIPEVGGVFTRAKGTVSMKDFGKTIFKLMKDREHYGDLKDLARLMGIMRLDAGAAMATDLTAAERADTKQGVFTKMVPTMFKFNGNDKIVEFTRVLSLAVGADFIQTQSGKLAALEAYQRKKDGTGILDSTGKVRRDIFGDNNKAWFEYQAALDWLAELGIRDFNLVPRWKAAGSPLWSHAENSSINDDAKAVQDALNTFVNEAVLNPTPGDRPLWFDTLWGQMVGHLKTFMYSFMSTVMGGFSRELSRRWRRGENIHAQTDAWLNSLPFMLSSVAVFAFLGALSEELRQRIFTLGERGSFDRANGDPWQYLENIADRTGFMQLPFFDALTHTDKGLGAITYQAGPAVHHIYETYNLLFSDDPNAQKAVFNSVPVLSQLPTLRRELYNLGEEDYAGA